MSGEWLALGAMGLLAAAGATRRGSRSQSFRFSGDTCPGSTADVVNWSTADWWYPTPVEEIEWTDFRDAVQITPQTVMASGYLPWKQGWEPFEEFLGRPRATYHEGFFKGTLPSGRPFYVWQGSGVEHWWTLRGDPVDTEYEQALIDALEVRLDLQKEDGHAVTLADTERELAQIIAGGSRALDLDALLAQVQAAPKGRRKAEATTQQAATWRPSAALRQRIEAADQNARRVSSDFERFRRARPRREAEAQSLLDQNRFDDYRRFMQQSTAALSKYTEDHRAGIDRVFVAARDLMDAFYGAVDKLPQRQAQAEEKADQANRQTSFNREYRRLLRVLDEAKYVDLEDE